MLHYLIGTLMFLYGLYTSILLVWYYHEKLPIRRVTGVWYKIEHWADREEITSDGVWGWVHSLDPKGHPTRFNDFREAAEAIKDKHRYTGRAYRIIEVKEFHAF